MANAKYRKTNPSIMELVGIGHALYDIRCYIDEFPQPDKTSFIKGHFRHNPGGSATNVVFNCAQLGLKTALIAKVGFDTQGRYITEKLGRVADVSGVKIDKKNPTGVSLVMINKEGQPEVVEMLGANATLMPKDLDLDLLEPARNLHITGTNLDTLEYAVRHTGAMISFDPGRSISRLGWQKLRKVLDHTDLLVVNKTEIKELGGEEAIRANFDLTLIIKGKPVVAYPAKGKKIVVKPPIIKARDTIGAGDAFVSGVLAKLCKNNSCDMANLEKAIKYGTALAAYKIERQGAEVAFTKAKIDSFAKKLTLA